MNQRKHNQRFSPRTKSITLKVPKGHGYLNPEPPPKTANCKKCRLTFDVGTFQSQEYCENCRKIPTCIHKIPITEPCDSCKKKTGSFFIRTM